MEMKAQDWSSTALNPVGLIIRQKDPNNLEMPFDQLGEFITPSELFYIRSHFPIPELVGHVSIVDTGRGTEEAELELRRSTRHAFKEMRGHTGMRR
jgi:hypothetical protein